MKITVPAIDLFLKESKPWGLKKSYFKGTWHRNYEGYQKQRTDPQTKGLLGTIGLKKNEKVLCVAAHRGTWSLALAKAGVKVTYSELSQELTKHAKKEITHKNVHAFTCGNYLLLPQQPNKYDWTFTFEAVGPKHFIFLRSLLNNKGGKYVIWDHSTHGEEKLATLKKTLALCSKLYKVKISVKRKQIVATTRDGETAKRPHHILTLRTSDSARTLAFRDLQLLQVLKKNNSFEKLSVQLSCTEEEVKDSLRRISQWTKLAEKKYAKVVRII